MELYKVSPALKKAYLLYLLSWKVLDYNRWHIRHPQYLTWKEYVEANTN
jgi:hypothetical protein